MYKTVKTNYFVYSRLGNCFIVFQSSLMASSTQLHELSTSEDKSARLKGAFLMACSGNTVSNSTLLNEPLF